MKRHLNHLANWLTLSALTLITVFLIAGGLNAAINGFDAPYRSAAADAAIQEHRAEIKKLQAAIAMCGGENAVAQDLGNGQYQCFMHIGKKTITAQVSK
jgi:hypothetical protein